MRTCSRLRSVPQGTLAELKVGKLRLPRVPLRPLVLSSPHLTCCALCMSPLLQRKLPADSKVLEASDLVYTVSAHEYWQQAFLTEDESGNFYFFLTSTTNIRKNKLTLYASCSRTFHATGKFYSHLPQLLCLLTCIMCCVDVCVCVCYVCIISFFSSLCCCVSETKILLSSKLYQSQ